MNGRALNRSLEWTLGATTFFALLLGATLWRYVRDFRLNGDSFPLALFSSPPYFSLRDWTTWFTQGYTEYFVNYPDWHVGMYAFARPVMNAAFYVQGLMVPWLGESAYLVVNYLAFLASIPLLVLIFVRYGGLSYGYAAVASVSIGLSQVWYAAFFWPCFGTNTLALFFSIAAIAVLCPRIGPPGPRRIFASAVLQVFAVASHETAILVPVISALMAFGRPNCNLPIRRLWPLLLPIVYFFITRSLLPGGEGVYALQVEAWRVELRTLRLLLSPFIPFDATSMLVTDRPTNVIGSIPLGLALVSNLAVYVVLFRAITISRTKHLGILLIALGVALLVALPTNTEPRFMGIALVLTMLLVFVSTEHAPWLRNAVLTLIVVTQAGLFAYGVVGPSGFLYEKMRSSGVAFDYVQTSITELEPEVIVLVNDSEGRFGANSMLRMAAWPREDVELVVLNRFEGLPAPDGRTHIGVTDGLLNVEVVFGEGQKVRFDGAVPDFSRPNNGFHYRSVLGDEAEERGSFQASRPLDGRRVVVLGTDLRTGEPFEPVVVDR